jgi:hypothetical protein
MEITGIYQAQKDLIDSLKNENSLYSIRYSKLLEQYAILETKNKVLSEECENLHDLCEDRSIEILKQELNKNKPKQEYTPEVIELTRQQVYHLMDFIEDNETVETVVIKTSCESGIGPTIKIKANIEMDLTEYSTW